MEKVKLLLNYSFTCDPRDIYMALTKPDYLQNWFADQVEMDRDTGVYTFHWNSSVEMAKIEESRPNEYVRWTWLEDDRGAEEYLSFRIEVLPGEDWIELHIEDFCDQGDEESQQEMWNEQISGLEKVIR